MSDNIYDILNRMARLDEGLSPQQKSVKQLPALFKPKNTSPQLAGPYPGKNATLGYLVGEESTNEGDVVPMPNRSGYNKLQDKDDYLDKRDVLFKLLSQAGIDPGTRQVAKERLSDLERAARMQGIIKEDSDNPMRDAVLGRISRGRMDLVQKYGLEAVMSAVDDVTEGDNDWEEIGSSDVSAYIRRVEEQLRDRFGSRDEIAEGQTTEDVLSTMKKRLGDYLQDVATAIKTDSDLPEKKSDDGQLGAAVKTIRTDDGHEIKIHGNEDDGFRISIRNHPSKTKFENLDHATMAIEMYCNRRRHMAAPNLDYVEEKNDNI